MTGPDKIERWIILATRGDRAAQGEIYRTLQPQVLNSLQWRVSPALDPEDICEEALHLLLLNLERGRLQPDLRSNLFAYTLRIALRIAGSRRKARSWNWHSLDGLTLAAKEVDLAKRLDDEMMSESLKDSLKPAEWELAVAIFLSKAKTRELSVSLGISPSALRKRRTRSVCVNEFETAFLRIY